MEYPEPKNDTERALAVLGYGPTNSILDACEDRMSELMSTREALCRLDSIVAQVRQSESSSMNHCVEYIPTRREKLGWHLFPAQHCDVPRDMIARDCVVTRTTANLSFIDRLRVLISGRIEVQAKTATENVVGKYATNASFCVRPPRWLDR